MFRARLEPYVFCRKVVLNGRFFFCGMLGPAEGEEESFTHQLRGVIPRAFEYLFSLVNREQEKVKLMKIVR